MNFRECHPVCKGNILNLAVFSDHDGQNSSASYPTLDECLYVTSEGKVCGNIAPWYSGSYDHCCARADDPDDSRKNWENCGLCRWRIDEKGKIREVPKIERKLNPKYSAKSIENQS